MLQAGAFVASVSTVHYANFAHATNDSLMHLVMSLYNHCLFVAALDCGGTTRSWDDWSNTGNMPVSSFRERKPQFCLKQHSNRTVEADRRKASHHAQLLSCVVACGFRSMKATSPLYRRVAAHLLICSQVWARPCEPYQVVPKNCPQDHNHAIEPKTLCTSCCGKVELCDPKPFQLHTQGDPPYIPKRQSV